MMPRRPELSLHAALPAILLFAAAVSAAEVEIVAHRGASHDAPENTLAAFQLAWEQGADAIEADFFLTSDDRIIAMHDATTQRTAGIDWLVAERTLAELRTLDVGRWKGERWAGERPPTLGETLDALPGGKRIFIEIKCGPEIVPALRRRIDRAGLDHGQTVVISFQRDVIAAVKEAMPRLDAYWLFAFRRDDDTGEWNETHDGLIETAERIGADGLALRANEAVNRQLADRLDTAGLPLHVWTVNDPDLARRMRDLGARSIITDRPAFIREHLAEEALAD